MLMHPLAEPLAGAPTGLMWCKDWVGARLNVWIKQQQTVYPPPVIAVQAIA